MKNAITLQDLISGLKLDPTNKSLLHVFSDDEPSTISDFKAHKTFIEICIGGSDTMDTDEFLSVVEDMDTSLELRFEGRCIYMIDSMFNDGRIDLNVMDDDYLEGLE